MSIDGDQFRLFPPQTGRATYTAHGVPLTPAKTFGGNAPYPTGLSPVERYKMDMQRAKPHEEQLRMFMRPHEILEKWGPLDGDREENWEGNGDYDDRRFNTGTSNEHNVHGNRNWTNPRSNTDNPYVRSGVGDLETDEHLWDRKEEEAFDEYGRQGLRGAGKHGGPVAESRATISSEDTKGRPLRPIAGEHYAYETMNSEGEYTDVQRPVYRNPGGQDMFGGESTLGDSLIRHGYRGTPIPLGFTKNMNNQREIVGGHHRMAVMKKHRQFDYLPVEYFRDIEDAKARGDYT